MFTNILSSDVVCVTFPCIDSKALNALIPVPKALNVLLTVPPIVIIKFINPWAFAFVEVPWFLYSSADNPVYFT